MLTEDEKQSLIQLICKEQNDMIKKDYISYQSKDYVDLEILKVKIKELED